MPLPLVDTLQQLGNRKLGFNQNNIILPNFKLFGQGKLNLSNRNQFQDICLQMDGHRQNCLMPGMPKG